LVEINLIGSGLWVRNVQFHFLGYEIRIISHSIPVLHIHFIWSVTYAIYSTVVLVSKGTVHTYRYGIPYGIHFGLSLAGFNTSPIKVVLMNLPITMANTNHAKPVEGAISHRLINPHNPEFITKKPWYLSDGVACNNQPTLDHQTDQRFIRPISLLTGWNYALLPVYCYTTTPITMPFYWFTGL
jgi:hypothetical protein